MVSYIWTHESTKTSGRTRSPDFQTFLLVSRHLSWKCHRYVRYISKCWPDVTKFNNSYPFIGICHQIFLEFTMYQRMTPNKIQHVTHFVQLWRFYDDDKKFFPQFQCLSKNFSHNSSCWMLVSIFLNFEIAWHITFPTKPGTTPMNNRSINCCRHLAWWQLCLLHHNWTLNCHLIPSK